MPPIPIVIASIWLVSVGLYGLGRFAVEYLNSSQNPIQVSWFVLIMVLGLANVASVLLFFLQKPRAHLFYYGSLFLLFLSGMAFFIGFARSGHQAGAYTAQCLTAALIFTIAYLPYRARFTKRELSS